MCILALHNQPVASWWIPMIPKSSHHGSMCQGTSKRVTWPWGDAAGDSINITFWNGEPLTMPLPLGPLGSDPWDLREWQNWDSSSPENLAEVRVLKCIRTFHVIRCSLMFQKHIGIRIVFHQPWPGFMTPLINSRKMTSLTHPIISGWLGSQHLQPSSAGRYQKTTMVSGKVGHYRTTGPVWSGGVDMENAVEKQGVEKGVAWHSCVRVSSVFLMYVRNIICICMLAA